MWGSAMRRKNANQFYNSMGDLITFEIFGGSMKVTFDRNGQVLFAGKRLDEFHPSEAELRDFIGSYQSPETDGVFQLSLEQGEFVLKIGSNPPVKLTAIAKDEFNAEGGFIVVLHRQAGKVSSLTASAPEARGIEFDRTN